MRTVALILLLAFGAGCSHTTVAVGSGTPPAASGTVVTSGSAGLNVTTTSGAAALAIVLTLGAVEYIRNPQPLPSPAVLIPPNSPTVPDMAAGRLISEQDCSKPVDLSLGNLRCK